MPVKLEVKSEDATIRAQAQRVLDCFGNNLPPSRLLCFLDDADPPFLKQVFGVANRGVYRHIDDNTPLDIWPDYVTSCIFVDDGISLLYPRVIDDLVYLYGSTSANEVSLTMALAHELQHVIQHANARELWALNGLVPRLHKTVIAALNLQWTDIPIEIEARIVSKGMALQFFGEQRVTQFIDEKIAEGITESAVADWQFVRTLTASSSVDLAACTKQLFKRLKGHKAELEAVLKEKKGDPDFSDIELGAYFNGEQ